MICVQISKPQNICLSFLTIIYRNELLKTNKCFSNKSFSQNKKVNKKINSENMRLQIIFFAFILRLTFNRCYAWWLICTIFQFFLLWFFFRAKDDKRQNNRTILTIKDYKKKNTSKPNDKLQTIRRQIQPPKSDLICRLFPWGFVISLSQITKRQRQVFIV